MVFQRLFKFSHDIVKMFNKDVYEQAVLEIMNLSKKVFRGQYERIASQSNGECDFADTATGEKFDAKLPFTSKQIEMLTAGHRHEPQIVAWIVDLQNEASEFDPLKMRNDPTYSVKNTKLYAIMKQQLMRDKADESIIFFIPFPIVPAAKGTVFLQLATDFLHAIYDCLVDEIDLTKRRLYAIWPSMDKNQFAIRRMDSHCTEYIYYTKLENYFSHEVV